MPGESHITNAVGALTVVGGVMGYAKKRSTASLMAGLLVGGMFLAGGQIIEVRCGNAMGGGGLSCGCVLGVTNT